MIKYSLGCDRQHSFEAWFRSSDAYDRQVRRRLVVCPQCGSTDIEKAPMAPALLKAGRAKARRQEPNTAFQKPSPADLRKLRSEILAKSENVGAGFAEEARRIHFGDAEERKIHGTSSLGEARALIEDGVPFGLIPPMPEDQN